MNTNHAIFNTERGEFECLHCGYRYKPNVPCPVSLFTAMCKAFVKDHRECEPKEQNDRN